jgi:DNA replication protein DnaC
MMHQPVEKGRNGRRVAAFLDRLMHHSHLIEIRGKSYRLHEHSLTVRHRKATAPA